MLDYLSLCQMEIVINFSRIYTQSLVLKVSFCPSEFGSSGLKMRDFGRNGKDLVLVLANFWGFSFNFECGKLCYFLQAERCILSILFKLIVQWQNEKFYFIILVMANKALKEAQNELES